MKISYHEKGQAMVEMCAGLVGILVIIIAIILISGINITNIRMLQESKSNAETSALSADVDDLTVRPDILSWDYGTNNIPFSGNDSAVNVANSESDVAGNALQSADYSQANAPNPPYEYDFTPLNEARLRTGSLSASANLGNNVFTNFATAANLISGSSTNNNTLYSYRFASSGERRAFYNAAAHWLGINPQTMFDRWRESNVAWMPKNADGEAVSIDR